MTLTLLTCFLAIAEPARKSRTGDPTPVALPRTSKESKATEKEGVEAAVQDDDNSAPPQPAKKARQPKEESRLTPIIRTMRWL